MLLFCRTLHTDLGIIRNRKIVSFDKTFLMGTMIIYVNYHASPKNSLLMLLACPLLVRILLGNDNDQFSIQKY